MDDVNAAQGQEGEKNHLEIFNDLTKSQASALPRIDACFSEWALIISKAWKRKFVYCLGEEGEFLLKGKNNAEGFSVKISDSEKQLVLDLINPENSTITMQKRKQFAKQIKQKWQKWSPEKLPENTDKDLLSLPDEIHEEFVRRNYPATLLQYFRSTLLPRKSPESLIDAYYLPAIRGGIMQSHRTLVDVLLERAPMVGLDNLSPVRPFNGVLADFMRNLINIGNSAYGRTRRADLRARHHRMRHGTATDKQKVLDDINTRMEQRILSGKIHIQESEAQYPDFLYTFKKAGKDHDVSFDLMEQTQNISNTSNLTAP